MLFLIQPLFSFWPFSSTFYHIYEDSVYKIKNWKPLWTTSGFCPISLLPFIKKEKEKKHKTITPPQEYAYFYIAQICISS